LPGLLDTAEVKQRLAAGLLAVHALSEVALDGHVQVRTEFGIEVAVESPATEKRSQAKERLPNQGEHFVFTSCI
jgi:hypothetical protein